MRSSLTILEENNYYPFGLKHSGYTPNSIANNSYNYKYNGKELQTDLDINLYDYGARNYDSAIGRWFNVDPLAEKYWMDSPYAYAVNNPVYFVDLDGMQIGGPGDGTGTEDDPIELQEAIVRAKKQERRDPIFGYNYNSDILNERSSKLSTAISNYKPAQQIDAVINETTFFVLTLPVGGVAFKGASFILKPVITKAGTVIWKKVATTAVLEAAESATSKMAIESIEQFISKFPNLIKKFNKHGTEWVAAGIEGYYNRAVSLANSKIGGKILGFTSKEGWTFRMNSKTGEFLTINPKGEITTFFRRLDNPAKYWAEQVSKYGQ